MSYEIQEIDLNENLENLSLQLPIVLTFLPENLDSAANPTEFIFTDSISDVRKIFTKNKIDTVVLGGPVRLSRARKNADIYLPALFFGLSLLAENPTIVSVSLNVLSNYISDFLKTNFGRTTAHVELYIETKEKGIVKKVSYNGGPEGLKELDKIILALK